MRRLLLCASLIISTNLYAFEWADLWFTKNQQAQKLMNKGQFKEAESKFENPGWRAAAAYRAGEYQEAAKQYQALQQESGFYNQGNALAKSGNYQQAIEAYNQALAINPKNQDALDNKKIIEDLLKKNKNQNQNQQNKDHQNKNKQDQNQQNQNNQNQNKQDQNQPNKDQQNQTTQDQEHQNQDEKNQNKQDQNQQKENQNKQEPKNQDKKDPKQQPSDQKSQDKQDKAQLNKTNPQAVDKKQSPEEHEKQQAKAQWLRLIPDDPAGLLREKFLRDHLRREEGWYQ